MTELDLSGRTFGEFLLRERIGVGGHGTVYRAEQHGLGRDAVVKVLRPRKPDGTGAERFVREAKLASRLDHPYSAHVYAFGVEPDGVRWIAMELVHGVSLGEWLRARGPMPLALFVPFLELVAEVVHAAHRSGIVHRDLKPSNVMVVGSGPRWLPKLLDFGIARPFDAPAGPDEEGPAAGGDGRAAATTARLRKEPPPYRTRTGPNPDAARLTPHGAMLGSAPYMSPEQWREPWNVGPAADVYALGCLAHEALTGRTPYSAADGRGYYELHACAEPPSLGGDFPPGVDRAIRRALAKSPKDRQESALDLAAELRAALRAEPHQQLSAAAQQWEDRARPPDLLWGRRVLADVERSVPSTTMSELECSFVAESHRRARRVRWTARSLAALAVLASGAVLVGRSAMETRFARQQARLAETEARAAHEVAEAKVTEAELERGRSALLHGEPEAFPHLVEAYRRDRSPATAFMLARAMQHRMSQLAQLPGTYGRMWSANFSPDGRRIATSDDRAAQIWDGRTYRLLHTLPHGREVYQAVYSPDGGRLVTVARTMVRIWDAESGALLHDLVAGRGQPAPDFHRVAVSPDGRLVAATDAGGALTDVWDSVSGALVAELRGPGGDFPRIAFGEAGWLATSGGGQARVFDVRTWKPLLVVPGPVRSLAPGAHGLLVTGSATGEVALWDVRGASRLRQSRPFGESVDAVAFSPDGGTIAAGSGDGVIQAWRTDSGARRSRISTRHGKIVGIEFGPGGALILAANADGTVTVADAAQGLPLAVLDGPSGALRTARFSPDGARVVGAARDGTARVWEGTSPYRTWASPPADGTCDIGMGTRSDGRFVAVGCEGLPTRIWDTSQDQLLAELPGTALIGASDFNSPPPAVSSAGDTAAIPRGTAVEVYGLPAGRLLRTIRHGAEVSAVAFADSGRALASGALDGSVRVVREDGTELALQASGGVEAVAVLPDGRVAVADARRRLRVFAADGTAAADLELPARVMSLRREGSRIVALSNCLADAAAPFLLDLARGRVGARLEGHVGCVLSARWVPGGRILTAGVDGTARLWDGSTGRLLRTYRGSPRFLADAVLASGVVVGGDADGLLRFWDAAGGERLWTLPAHASAVVGVHLEGTDLVTRGSTGEISRWRLPQSEAVIGACARHPPCGIVP
jgi:WD40 repeat protein/serine/threonine protein kinase